MANPFATQTVIDPATDKQITLADKLIREREWHSGGEHYVRRTAALGVVLDWSLNPMADRTPAEISRLINSTVGRVGSYGERVNVVLAHLESKGEDATRPYYGQLTKRGASQLIDLLLGLPERANIVRQGDVSHRRQGSTSVPSAVESLSILMKRRTSLSPWYSR